MAAEEEAHCLGFSVRLSLVRAAVAAVLPQAIGAEAPAAAVLAVLAAAVISAAAARAEIGNYTYHLSFIIEQN